MLSSLDTTKASGPDGISGKTLKQTATAIAPSITALFNLSIKCNQPPKDWKYAKVVPIPKQPRTTTPGGFRPISLLSILSKLLEKHFHRLIVDHLTEHSPLSNVQWGFQKGKSTVSALLSTTDSWLKHLERGYDVGAVFFDFKKAFDRVPHLPLVVSSTISGMAVVPRISEGVVEGGLSAALRLETSAISLLLAQ